MAQPREIRGQSTTITAKGPAVIVTRRASDRLRNGHLWVYRTDITELVPAEIPGGSLVTVADTRGIPLGTGLYSSASQIAVRMVSRETGLTDDDLLALVRERVETALLRRNETGVGEAARLIFSEADALPGIIADRYNDLVILQLLTQATAVESVRKAVVDTLLTAFPDVTLWERPDPRIRELEQLPPVTPEPLHSGSSPKSATVFTINGLNFHYDVSSGQKTGAFLDQRLNYAAAANHAKGRGLDICTYQGGFALHLATRCQSVTGVDVSRAALEVADRNLVLNPQIKAEVDWIEADAFELLREFDATGERFQTIVLDPPAFAKSKRAVEGALRGYKELNLRAMKMLDPGGTLVTCSCSHHVSREAFIEIVAAAAADAGRRVQLLELRGAAPDHPEVLTLPETGYLKCLICRVD